ncbi:gamma-glutamyltransferase family protein [Nonomuraea sp. NPDC050404]|uniref:gamma-glutamyltransferase family protein n=1 Tax=Nonomuraea sp. NPDC050404 TaxID=3155783 RepID=UPI0033DBE40E
MKKPERRLPEHTGMVVAPQPEAVEAGAEVLRRGGNAVDAAICTALVQGVVDPLMCGIGGFGIMQVHDPVTGSPVVFEGMGTCPSAAHEAMWRDKILGETTDGFGFIVEDFANEAGALSVQTPGTLRILIDSHRRFGTLPWAELFAPAIEIARSGWLVRPHTYTVFIQDERKYGRMNYGDKLGLTPDGRRIYLHDDGSYKRIGEWIRNPDLANTLESLADDGGEGFYTGALAARIADDIQRNGGILSPDDLRDFAGRSTTPLRAEYRGICVSAPAAPGGGTLVAQILSILEHFDIAELQHNSAAHIAVLAEAMKVALRDKENLVGDPDFTADVSGELLSPDYARRTAAAIQSGQRVAIDRIGAHESPHTTHVSTVDPQGVMVSFTHTLGNPSGFIPAGTGFMMNGGMSTFDPRPGKPNSIAPGKRRYSSMSPTLLMSQGQPFATLGAPGASWIGPAVAQVISNIIDWGMEAQEAVSAPRIVATSNAIDVSNRVPRSVQRELEKDGYEVRRSPLSYAFAGVHAITGFDGELRGGADPQRDGMAQGVTPGR